MDGEEQLRWVMRSRSRPDRARHAGTVISRMSKEKWGADVDRLAGAAMSIGALGDDEFRTHCSLAGMNGGVLTINVDDPVRVSEMRHRWLDPLRRAVSGRGKGTRIRTVVFTLGTEGVPIGR